MTADQTESHQARLHRDKNLWIIFSVTLMAILGVSSIAPALPAMRISLNVSSQQIGWLITIFTLPGILFTPFLGALSDRWGRKNVLVPSLFVFSIFGFFCTFASNFNMLLLFRFFQGAGAAAIGALNITILGDLYCGTKRTEAMGYNAAVLSVGTAIYPAIGGWLALFGWNYPFLLSLLAIPVGFLVSQKLENPEPERYEGMNIYLGQAAKAISNRNALGLYGATVISFVIIYGICLTAFPIWMSEEFGASPFTIGIFLSMMSVGTIVAAVRLGAINQKISERRLILVGSILYALICFVLPLFQSMKLLIIPTVLFGAAHGFNIPSTQSLLASIAKEEYRGAVMALNGTLLRVGQTIGPLVVGVCIAAGGTGIAFFGGGLIAVMMIMVVFLYVNQKKTGSDISQSR